MGNLFQSGVSVRHPRFGVGTVLMDNGPTTLVRFADSIQECLRADLQPMAGLEQRLQSDRWDAPLDVINRAQAEAILSVNDTWGVFSRSRVALLPHQLWVCSRVNAQWPTRWLVADDVGLGKTIEAGMILWPLLSRGTVRRLLILCPASLVEQWQYRLRTMFDIRLVRYATEADTPKSDFWGTHPQVVASLHTLRMDHSGRRRRLLEADPWDMLIVDEAHHLNADEQSGYTLGYHLVHELQERKKIRSMLFFTGTPHRGKDYGFVSLLELLRPDLFNNRQPAVMQIHNLSQVMIRNNKSAVTDLQGNRLFHPPQVSSETYAYSDAEQRFYDLLSLFILTGRAYASGLDSLQGRAVMLVLIAMQKLASSSVAAIRRAIRGRLQRLQESRQRVEELQAQVQRLHELEEAGETDALAALEEKLAAEAVSLRLTDNEEPALRELLAAADMVQTETKIERILDILEQRFTDRSVLFFTEYKATQSLLMSALMHRYGDSCVTFINGDERAEGVLSSSGRMMTIHLPREAAAERFNTGSVRFLVSTEAGGEGIDLQERCHTLIHVDLPWNPMRLHQRVGRLNRYGQTQQVEVVTLRNPDTVESLIWDKLNEKLERITHALGEAMEEPEDLLQLVLGMTSPSVFRDLFADAPAVSREKLTDWFDQKSATFGGKDVVESVKHLVGNVSRFDFQQVSNRLPRVDLPDLLPFFEISLLRNRRRYRIEDGEISFLTPTAWRQDPMLEEEYQRLHFNRLVHAAEDARRLLGIGHRVMTQSLDQAAGMEACLTTLPGEILPGSLFCFRVKDRVTGQEGAPRGVIVGVARSEQGSMEVLWDWQLLLRLNRLPYRKAIMQDPSRPLPDIQRLSGERKEAEEFLHERLPSLELPFQVPDIEILAILSQHPT